MVHIIFDINSPKYQHFFNSQYGEGNIFRGIPFQRGYGIQRGQGLGNVLSTIWRLISPSVRSVGQQLGQESLATGSRILKNLSEGNALKQVIPNELKEGAKNVFKKQNGGGKRKIVGRGYTLKKTRRDALGSY